jgi:hypothetical protein
MKRLLAPALCALVLLALPAIAAAMPAPESQGPVHAVHTAITQPQPQPAGNGAAIILASAALAVALAAAGYVVVRVRPRTA